MNKTTQKIGSVSKDAFKKPSFNKAKLEEIITTIISRTSYSNTSFTNSINDYSESSKRAKINKITIKQDSNNSRFLLRIQLVGDNIIWIVTTTFHNNIQGNIQGFFKELREAAKSVCEEENKKLPIPSPPPSPDTKDKDSNPTDTPKGKRKKGVRTASVITDEVILKILKIWMKHSGGVQKISQREFGTIVSKMGIEIKNNLLVTFLKKKGVVNVISIARRPIVEISMAGIEMLEKHEKHLDAEKLEAEKIKHMKKMLGFAKKSLPTIHVVKNQKNIFARLDELEIAEKSAAQKIIACQQEILRQEAVLTKIGVARKDYFEKMRKLGTSVDHAIVDELIETAEDSL